MDKLEKVLGVDLFKRVDGKLGLTEPGRKAAELGRDILGLLDRMQNLKTELPASREIIGVTPDIFNALQLCGGGRKPTGQRRVVLETSVTLRKRFDEKMLGMVVRYVHDYEVADHEHFKLPLIWAVSRDSNADGMSARDTVVVDLPARDHPIHQAAINTLRRAGLAYTVARELPEGVYIPVQRDAGEGPVHMLVPQFQMERLNLKPSPHPLLQEPLCVHMGIFSHREFFAVADVEAFADAVDAALRNICGGFSRPCSTCQVYRNRNAGGHHSALSA